MKKNWKTRWFVLWKNELKYFRNRAVRCTDQTAGDRSSTWAESHSVMSSHDVRRTSNPCERLTCGNASALR